MQFDILKQSDDRFTRIVGTETDHKHKDDGGKDIEKDKLFKIILCQCHGDRNQRLHPVDKLLDKDRKHTVLPHDECGKCDFAFVLGKIGLYIFFLVFPQIEEEVVSHEVGSCSNDQCYRDIHMPHKRKDPRSRHDKERSAKCKKCHGKVSPRLQRRKIHYFYTFQSPLAKDIVTEHWVCRCEGVQYCKATRRKHRQHTCEVTLFCLLFSKKSR
jgi:hypothetical protein